MNRFHSFVLFGALALTLAACGGGGEDVAPTTEETTTTKATTTTTTSTTSTTTTTTTTIPVTVRQPLTGAPLESEAGIVARPALVAKIDNNPRAVPNHSGLAVADIVFEEVVEGRTTRFAAVFHSQGSDPVGPLRSGRTQDINLVTSFNSPLFVWSGGNPTVTRLVNESSLVNLGPGRADGYFRGAGGSPHNLYNSTERIWAQTPPDHPGPPPQQFQYLDDDEPVGGLPVDGVRVRVGGENVEWTWNPDAGRFDRSQRGRPHNDSLFGRIGATNVVVMGVTYAPSPADRNSPEAQTIGEGPVWVFTDGGVRNGTWKRESSIFPIEFFDADGAPIELRPGNTWIELAQRSDTDGNGVQVIPVTAPAP
jgi:hypothetical protein